MVFDLVTDTKISKSPVFKPTSTKRDMDIEPSYKFNSIINHLHG